MLAWDRAGRWVAGATLVLAAVYELTPLKDVCLGKCRSPLGFLLGAWRDGWAGALQMGAKNGAWCVGCCWALMASLFALGLMSIVWMALVAGLIAIEKTLPWRRLRPTGRLRSCRARRAVARRARRHPGPHDPRAAIRCPRWSRWAPSCLPRGWAASYRVGVYSEPRDLERATLADALERHWSIAAARLDYLPVGFGSHHWEAADARGVAMVRERRRSSSGAA